MKKIWLMAALAVTISTAALADEQQVYSPYPQPTFSNDPAGAAAEQAIANQSRQPLNHYMVYPGREQYGDQYGYIPRHPGDYRDAVDRGQWEGGGGALMPRRSHTGY